MPSSPLGSTNGLTTSSVDCQHHLWAAHTVERRRAWHSIIALGRHTRSNDVRRDMPSPPLDSTHDRTKLGITCHHRPCTAHTVGRRVVWHAITALEKHPRSNDVGRGMTSPPLDCTHGRTTSCLTLNHRLWAAHTIERRRAWHDITALLQHTRSNDVGLGMTSLPLDGTHGRTTSGVE